MSLGREWGRGGGDRGALAAASAALRSNPAAGLANRYGITECGGSLGTAAS